MTRSGSAARSPRIVSGIAGRVAGFGFVALGAIAAAQYLAGYFFLWSYDRKPLSATPLTIARYWHFYSDNADVRRRLRPEDVVVGEADAVICQLEIPFEAVRVARGQAGFFCLNAAPAR